MDADKAPTRTDGGKEITFHHEDFLSIEATVIETLAFHPEKQPIVSLIHLSWHYYCCKY